MRRTPATMAQFLSKKPTLDEIMKHIRIIKKLYKFGELLHLHANELDAIEELNQDSDADFKTLKMFYLWLDTNPFIYNTNYIIGKIIRTYNTHEITLSFTLSNIRSK